ERWRPHALALVARLGIADHLANGPLRVADLARASGTHADSLLRVLRALARDGVFAEPSPGTFANNSLSAVLRSDRPGSMRHTVIQSMDPWNNACWNDLERSVRTSAPAFNALFGKDLWGYLEDHPEQGAHFHRSMSEFTQMSAAPIAAAYDFARF